MLIHKDWLFVANPRTASRSVEQMLVTMLGDAVRITDVHHPKTNHPAFKRGLPTYGIVRDPLDQLVSWYHHMGLDDFEAFLKDDSPNWLLKRMTIYAGYMTHAFPLELGVTEIVNTIVGNNTANMYEEPYIGATGADKSLWTPALITYAQQKYAQDFELYWETLKRYKTT